MLVLVMIEVIRTPDYGALDAVWFLVRQIGIGAGMGALVGVLATFTLKRLASAPSGLSLVASVATAGIAYGAAASLHGSGFLSVYLAALMLGDADVPTREALLPFHEGLAALADIGMFFALGLLVFPSQLGGVLVRGTLLALLLAFVARPLGAFAATARSRFTVRERILIGWAGLRGGVPVVLATLPLIDHVPRSLEFFNLVFFAVLVSALIQGATVELLANRLGDERRLISRSSRTPRRVVRRGPTRCRGARAGDRDPEAPSRSSQPSRPHRRSAASRRGGP